VVRVGELAFVVAQVPSGLAHVYHWEGRYLHRVGAATLPLEPGELRDLLLERSEEGFDGRIVPGATWDELDMEEARACALASGADSTDLLAWLRERGCVREVEGIVRPTYAGVLLFGHNPQAYLPQARILLVHRAGTAEDENLLACEEAGGTLPAQVRRAEAFLVERMHRGRMWVGDERVSVPEYPVEAVREALVNAVVHRDYARQGEEIRVTMWADRIEVYSPGRLPGSLRVQDLPAARYVRNPRIARILGELGLLQGIGAGVGRIQALMREARLPPPEWQESSTGVRLVLYGPKGVPLSTFMADPQSLARLGLNERQVQIVLSLNERGRLTSRECQELCPQVSAETLRRDLADLIARGLLLKVGESRATYYILR
jgi:ATP-dependent DNA helicase RecG